MIIYWPSFPGLLQLQFLIACSMQKWILQVIKTRNQGRPGNKVIVYILCKFIPYYIHTPPNQHPTLLLPLLLRLRDLRAGTLVGTDQFGNKYYQNNDYFFG